MTQEFRVVAVIAVREEVELVVQAEDEIDAELVAESVINSTYNYNDLEYIRFLEVADND